MTRHLSVTAVLVIACLSTVGCRNSSPGERAVEVNQAKAFTETMAAIRKQCQAETPNWAAVSASLKSVESVLQGCDTRFETTYATDLAAAAELCANGENVAVNSQVILTSLELIVIKIIGEQLEFTPMYDERDHANALIKAYFEGIRFRLKACDNQYFKDLPFLEREAEDSIRYLNATQGSDVIMAVEDMQNILFRTYALSILHELETVATKPGDPAAKVALKRAELFYTVLEDRFRLLARKEHSLLTTMLTGEPAAVNLKDAEAAIQNGLGQGFLLK